jgi:hypothetical protein
MATLAARLSAAFENGGHAMAEPRDLTSLIEALFDGKVEFVLVGALAAVGARSAGHDPRRRPRALADALEPRPTDDGARQAERSVPRATGEELGCRRTAEGSVHLLTSSISRHQPQRLDRTDVRGDAHTSQSAVYGAARLATLNDRLARRQSSGA